MEVELIGNKQAAEEILQLTKLWDQALENRDLKGLTNGYSSAISSFDIGTQLVGLEKYKNLWESCLPYFGNAPKAYRRHFKIYASESLAFIHCFSKICGSNMPSPEAYPWCRTTLCFHKAGEGWQVVHEHISMPINFEEGKPALIIGEP